jgi:hypothetical protein
MSVIDRQRLRKRMRIILTVGGILIALAYGVPAAHRTRANWQRYRRAAANEAIYAKVQAKHALDADLEAEALMREGRTSEAERYVKGAENYRRREAMHQRKAQKYLERWW